MFTFFQNFTDIYIPEKIPLFLDFANSRLPWKNYLFCAKVGTSVVYVLIWSGDWGPFHQRWFHRNSNSVEISCCSHPCCSELIVMKLCTLHHSCAIAACAISSSDPVLYTMELHKNLFSVEFQLRWKKRSWNGPLATETVETLRMQNRIHGIRNQYFLEYLESMTPF